MAEPNSLDVACERCGKPVTLQLDGEKPKRRETIWQCPWCGGRNEMRVVGRVKAIQAGH